MATIKSFNEIPDIECLSGDTLDEMEITIDGMSELTNPTMKCIISKRGSENSVLVTKDCTATSTGFTVQLTSSDTQQLRGAYWLDFVLTASGIKFKRLRGCLIVHPQYGGAS